MLYTTQIRLILSFVGISLLVGGLSLFVGGKLINRTVLGEATNRIRQDLNAAREIYRNVESRLSLGLEIAAGDEHLQEAARAGDAETVRQRLSHIARDTGMDFAGFVDRDGRTVCRLGSGGTSGPASPQNARVHPAAFLALERGTVVRGTVVLDRQTLAAEDPALAERAQIRPVPTPHALSRAEAKETSGMTISCAVPVRVQGEVVGVLYGGVLLNRSEEIVDRVRQTVFQDETYRGQSIGTATIFLQELRISTNVRLPQGQRAIGTRVSQEVKSQVLEEGKRWTDRAFVVHDWYITAYEPITDIRGRIVGILYVGVLEAKYADIRRHTLLVFSLITAAGMVLAAGLGLVLGQCIWRPVHELIEISHRVSAGDLSPRIGPFSRSEIGVLQRTFMEMLSSLRERDRRQRAESERKLLHSEKQASIGRLAAGVAHEINNPLTGVLTFTHMLLRRKDLGADVQADLQTIADATERVRKIVKGLLDFSRQTAIDLKPTPVNAMVKETLDLVANEALVKGVNIRFDPSENLPAKTLDKTQFESVLLNILLNALDATEAGGLIQLSTGIGASTESGGRQGIEIAISDTGCGIPPDHLDKIFDPFFTTKEVGKGTGLGLSVSLGIVERHGGMIRVRSQVGKGSIFVIWLPFEESA